MESCNYHPLAASNFYCNACAKQYCTDCVDHSVASEARCFLCGGDLAYHVSTANIEPFWRRLEKAFKYPLNTNALTMVFGLAVLSSILTSLPLPGLVLLLLSLIVAGATVNYSFKCLTSTSDGDMTAPNMADAFSGTLGVLWQLLVMTLLVGAVVFILANQVSPWLGMLAGLVVIVGSPAILMCFAHTGSVLESINPLVFLRLIYRVGLAYWVLIIFLLIMMSSVTVISQLIGNQLSALSSILQATVTNYYAVVMFHLMGYLLYQYQDRLGFATADLSDQARRQDDPADVVLAHINVRLKEGEYQRVDELFRHGIELARRDKRLWARYFEFLVRTGHASALQTFADPYLNFLLETAQTDRLASDYKKIRQVAPAYLPAHPNLRFQLANQCQVGGDALSVVQLINGMHRQFPDYDQLIAAYRLMKLALDDLPKMAGQAEKCQSLIESLQRKALVKSAADGADSAPSPESSGSA